MSKYSNILTYLTPGQPEPFIDQGGVGISYEYIGPLTTLQTNTPNFNDDWNGLPVLRVTGPTVMYKSAMGKMIIEVKQIDSAAVIAAGLAQITGAEFPLQEVEEEPVEKSLRQHPAFATMPAADWNAVDLWQVETDSAARAAYQYWIRDDNGKKTGSIQTLSLTNQPNNNAQDYARLFLMGADTFVDYLPVASETKLYYGQDKPTVGPIGTKISGDPFSSVPSGYEWVLSAYRSTKQGRGFYWTVTRKWTGAIKVLYDSTTIY